MATVGARLLGAGLVVAVESVPRRKQLAKEFGDGCRRGFH